MRNVVKKWMVVTEWLVGGVSVLLGLLLQIMLLKQGTLVPGALMLVVTGALLAGIAWKDQQGLLYSQFGENVLIIVRRTLLFLNLMLSLLVAMTLMGALA